jgi:hypothetical protein
MTGSARRPQVFGPEPWIETAGEVWSHFDAWFALVVVSEFGGDLSALQAALEEQHRASVQSRTDVEAKLSHLADLRRRLEAADLDVRELAAAAPTDKATAAKARRKVLTQALEGRAMTEPMRRTPSALLHHRARYGGWPAFPVDPRPWFDELRGAALPLTFVSRSQTFERAKRYRQRLERLDRPRLENAERLALHRAFHTLGLELANSSDDSYGQIGELRLEEFTTYLSLDPHEAGMTLEAYWQDLCELLVAETYALTHADELLPFRAVHAEAADMIEAILLGLAMEWRVAYQDFHAEQADTLIAWLVVATGRRDRYVATAKRLGSRQWKPIVTLATSALERKDRHLAVEVFRAADQPGWHQDYLRRRCAELTGAVLTDSIHTT